MRRLLFTAIVALLPAAADAAGSPPRQYQESAKGWHFYEPTPPEPKKVIPPPPPPAPAPPPAQPVEPVEPEGPAPLSAAWLRENMQQYLDKAIDDPTPENVELYAMLQRLAMDKAERYALMSSRVTTSNPLLDESARSPISSIQQSAAQAQMSVAKKAALEKISKRAGIWYFFLSTCPYCARQEPILDRVSANLGLSILPISLDGGAPPTWGESVAYVHNDGHAERLGVMVTPTMVMADTVTGELHTLGAGIRTDSEIESRMLELGVMNEWITETEYENAVRGEPRRYLADGLPEGGVDTSDPMALLEALRRAGVNDEASPWIVAPQGTTQ